MASQENIALFVTTELNILSRVNTSIRTAENLGPCLASLSYMAAGTAAGRVTSFYVILLK